METSAASPEQRALLEWGERVRRDLPWRRTRDPWSILVSEFMLQQTPVARVSPKWVTFVSRWPQPADLAEASLTDVLDVWSGLGYPRRARWLREGARIMVERFAGQVPEDLGRLLELPGVGPYTARAVLAFAFEHDVGVVDTNIARVLARRRGEPLSAGAAQQLADDFVTPGHGWSHNQALMDLGASMCRATPTCEGCPLRPTCAFGSRASGEDPAPRSAGVSRPQARFEGSDRQARGELLRALSGATVPRQQVAAIVGRTDAVAGAVVAGLVADGLVVVDDDQVGLAR